MTRTLQIVTLGCSKNRVDTEHILSQVKDRFMIIPEGEDCAVDILMLNTCGFIGDAKEESVQAVLEAVERKKRGEVGRLIVFGCLSQRYSAEMPELIPEVDAWFGARETDPIVRELGVEPSSDREKERYLTGHIRSYAFLKISEGCDRRCSYCAIPFIRGAHKSVPMETLVDEATFLASQGVKELIIIAQDTTYYGLDLYHKRCLAELLQRLSEVEGIEWLRIHYSYPADFPEDVLEQMATNPKVCKYLDIPLQHVSDKVLDMMHRHVDGAWTRNLIKKLREKVPGVVLRTTMIVGHPGEGEGEFDELVDFVRKSGFERLGAFTYSEEEGTFGAEHYEDSIPQVEKDTRLNVLMSLQSEISLAFNQSRIGSVERVLVDDYVDGVMVCRSQYESPDVDGEILVKYDSDEFVGRFIDVRIVGADEYDLIAETL